MDPIRARYAGTCTRTGKPYQPGDLIVKTARGWALAQDRKGNLKIAPDFRLCRLPDGAEKQIPLHLPLSCSQCLRADGHDPARLSKEFDFTPYHMLRQDDHIICPRCGRRIEIISQAELDRRKAQAETEIAARYQADLERNLHLRPVQYGWFELSHRLPRPLWDKVAEHFVFWSHDDLDQMDYFDMPGGYYLKGDPAPEGVFLNGAPTSSRSRAEVVEDLLSIRPKNRLAVLIPKWEQEREERGARAERRRQRQARFDALFPCETYADVSPLPDGALTTWAKVEISDRGGSENCLLLDPDGQHLWRFLSGWADMRWYRCGRFPLDRERQEALQWAKEGWIQ